MRRAFIVGLAAAASAAVALVPAQAASATPKGNQLLASGTVSENLGGPPSDWTITFDIHARSNGQSSLVSITQGSGGPTSTFNATTCTGSYTDPTFGGTDVYAVGPVVSGNEIYGFPYEVYVVHEGGQFGADASWSVPAGLPDLASAQAFCGGISGITPAFGVDGGTDVVFKV